MNLYILRQEQNRDYDTYDALLVAAESAEEAQRIRPDDNQWPGSPFGLWAHDLDAVTVELIGVAADHIQPGILLGSFNAG